MFCPSVDLMQTSSEIIFSRSRCLEYWKTMILWFPISYRSWMLKLDQKNIFDHKSILKSD
jgi:hypothetical protein